MWEGHTGRREEEGTPRGRATRRQGLKLLELFERPVARERIWDGAQIQVPSLRRRFSSPVFWGGSVGALGKMCTLCGIEMGTLGRNPPLTQTWGWTLPTSGCLSGGFLCPTGYEAGRWRPASRRMHAREFVTLKGRIVTGLSQVGLTLDLEAHGGHRKAKGLWAHGLAPDMGQDREVPGRHRVGATPQPYHLVFRLPFHTQPHPQRARLSGSGNSDPCGEDTSRHDWLSVIPRVAYALSASL